jgi:hypothetical protein
MFMVWCLLSILAWCWLRMPVQITVVSNIDTQLAHVPEAMISFILKVSAKSDGAGGGGAEQPQTA